MEAACQVAVNKNLFKFCFFIWNIKKFKFLINYTFDLVAIRIFEIVNGGDTKIQ